MPIDLKVILSILKNKQELNKSENIKDMCTILAISVNDFLIKSTSQEFILPNEYTNRHSIWVHIKICVNCWAIIRALAKIDKAIDIRIFSKPIDYSRAGTLMVQIVLKEYRKNDVEIKVGESVIE